MTHMTIDAKDSLFDNYDLDDLMEATALVHDRLKDRVEQFGFRRLAIPKMTRPAFGITTQWNHHEVPMDLAQLLQLCEWFHLWQTQPGVLTEAAISPSVDDPTAIALADAQSALENQMVVNREQSKLIAQLTLRCMDAGVSLDDIES